MIKFTAQGNQGTTLIGLGLTEANVARLRAGQPMRIHLRDLGFVGVIASLEIGIFLGADEETLLAHIRPFMDAQTVVSEVPPR